MGIGGAGVIGATGYGAYTLVQPKNIGEKLEWEGKTLLNTNPDDETDKDKWQKLITKYAESSTTTTNRLDELQEFPGDASDDAAKIKKLKQACKDAFKKPLSDETTDRPKLDKVIPWCTHQSTHLSS